MSIFDVFTFDEVVDGRACIRALMYINNYRRRVQKGGEQYYFKRIPRSKSLLLEGNPKANWRLVYKILHKWIVIHPDGEGAPGLLPVFTKEEYKKIMNQDFDCIASLNTQMDRFARELIPERFLKDLTLLSAAQKTDGANEDYKFFSTSDSVQEDVPEDETPGLANVHHEIIAMKRETAKYREHANIWIYLVMVGNKTMTAILEHLHRPVQKHPVSYEKEKLQHIVRVSLTNMVKNLSNNGMRLNLIAGMQKKPLQSPDIFRIKSNDVKEMYNNDSKLFMNYLTYRLCIGLDVNRDCVSVVFDTKAHMMLFYKLVFGKEAHDREIPLFVKVIVDKGVENVRNIIIGIVKDISELIESNMQFINAFVKSTVAEQYKTLYHLMILMFMFSDAGANTPQLYRAPMKIFLKLCNALIKFSQAAKTTLMNWFFAEGTPTTSVKKWMLAPCGMAYFLYFMRQKSSFESSSIEATFQSYTQESIKPERIVISFLGILYAKGKSRDEIQGKEYSLAELVTITDKDILKLASYYLTSTSPSKIRIDVRTVIPIYKTITNLLMEAYTNSGFPNSVSVVTGSRYLTTKFNSKDLSGTIELLCDTLPIIGQPISLDYDFLKVYHMAILDLLSRTRDVIQFNINTSTNLGLYEGIMEFIYFTISYLTNNKLTVFPTAEIIYACMMFLKSISGYVGQNTRKPAVAQENCDNWSECNKQLSGLIKVTIAAICTESDVPLFPLYFLKDGTSSGVADYIVAKSLCTNLLNIIKDRPTQRRISTGTTLTPTKDDTNGRLNYVFPQSDLLKPLAQHGESIISRLVKMLTEHYLPPSASERRREISATQQYLKKLDAIERVSLCLMKNSFEPLYTEMLLLILVCDFLGFNPSRYIQRVLDYYIRAYHEGDQETVAVVAKILLFDKYFNLGLKEGFENSTLHKEWRDEFVQAVADVVVEQSYLDTAHLRTIKSIEEAGTVDHFKELRPQLQQAISAKDEARFIRFYKVNRSIDKIQRGRIEYEVANTTFEDFASLYAMGGRLTPSPHRLQKRPRTSSQPSPTTEDPKERYAALQANAVKTMETYRRRCAQFSDTL